MKLLGTLLALVLAAGTAHFQHSSCPSTRQHRFLAASLAAVMAALPPTASLAEVAYRPSYEASDILRLKYGLKEVTFLINNWEEKTQTCNFGEIQRDILLSANKDKLMKAAAKGSLIDYSKSGTIDIMCKRDPQVVRAFLGLMPEENDVLFQADKLMRRPATMNKLRSDVDFEQYIAAVDGFELAISSVDSLSYDARTDYSSTETAKKGDTSLKASDAKKDYLSQCRDSVIIARDYLQQVVDMLSFD